MVVTEVLTDGTTSIRRQVEQGSRISRAGGHNNRLIHDPFTLEAGLQGSDFGRLLTNGHINIDNATFLASLINHRINGDSCFTSLAITNNQFPLTTTNWYNRVTRHNAGHQRRPDNTTGKTPWSPLVRPGAN